MASDNPNAKANAQRIGFIYPPTAILRRSKVRAGHSTRRD